ncbi:hypothetical protein FQR65_LT12205 [Abscondita terminalis]|nr:hypothetical protein FQR65_LT12205 [Abscondita terminalis]
MEVLNNSFLPGDPRLIDHIVYELKSQGIFDNFRKECIADVDTKPAYQNLRQRVEGSVSGFLKSQRWRSDMNKNHVREMLRKSISESGFLETGVERIVDQVVNPKINSIFLPQVENVVYKVLGIEKPTAFDDLKKQIKDEISSMDLLPNDLEAVSPESEPHDKKVDIDDDIKVNDKIDEDESPPFEPLEETMAMEENSVDSNLSGISGLVSHDSNHSVENKPVPIETSNQDSQFSKQSSDDRLSIVMSDDQELKMELNEDSNASICKPADPVIKSADVPDTSLTEKKLQPNEKSDEQEKPDDKRGDNKKSEKHRSSHRHSSHRSRHDSHKDRKNDRDKKEHKSSRTTGEDSKRDKDKKDRSRSGREDNSKSSKDPKERERTSSTSKHKRKDSADHKDDKAKSESKDAKTKERSKEDTKLKSHSSSKKIDSKSHSKHNGKSKTESSDSAKKENSKKNDKHKREDEKRSDRHKDKKDLKKDGKKEKDDHYGLKEKKTHRRSTDRDSSDGHSGTHSSSSSYAELTTPSQVQKSSQESSLVSGSSSGGDSGNSDACLTIENLNISSIPCVLSEEEHSQIIASVPHLKLIKPKFASNIFEARRLMKIRRKLGKLEKQKQMELLRVNSINVNKINNHMESRNMEKKDNVDGNNKQRQDVVKKRINNSHVKSYKYQEKSMVDEDNLVEEVQLSDDMELQTSVISKESWDAIEAKLNAQNILKVDYNSYTATFEDKPKVVVQKDSDCKGFVIEEETKRRLDVLSQIIETRQGEIRKLSSPLNRKKVLPLMDEVINEEIHKLPKIDIVDVTSNNEVVFSPGRGIKRIVSNHDMHNNNKINKDLGDVLSDRLNDLTENHNQSSNPSKSKKSKLTDTSVNSLENFNLPLSPAESDKSFNSVGDKKGDVLEANKTRKNRAISNQRYSSDDLYKPRLQFSSKRRRATKNSEEN